MNNASKNIHICHFDGCNASFSRPYKLEFHIKKHNGEKPFICTVDGCSKSYTTPSHLKRHNITAHEKAGGGKEILCKICGMSCSNKYNFKKHFCIHHASDLPFKCTQCTKEFKKKKQLLEHMCIHSGEHPYRCEICNTGFNKIHLLNKHKRNHKTYTCDCGETFPRWSIFCAHRKNSCSVKAVDHKCVICSKIFTTKSNLKMHSLIHVDESQLELFHCPYKNCNRSYKYKKNVNEHIKAFHEKSKEKLELNCTEPECQTVLSTYVNLKRHLINVHKTKFKKKKTRKTRSDKGKIKKSPAVILSGIKLNEEEHIKVAQSMIKNSSITQSLLENESITNVVNSNEENRNESNQASSINQDMIGKRDTSECIDNYDSNKYDLTTEFINPFDDCLDSTNEVLSENNDSTTRVANNIALTDQNNIFSNMEVIPILTSSHDSCQNTNLENRLQEINPKIGTNADSDPTVSDMLLDHCNILVNAETYITSNNDLDTLLFQECTESLQKLQNCAG